MRLKHNEGHHFYVDEHWQCLYYVNLGMLNSVTEHVAHQLLHYYPAGTFEETYAKIYELYGPSLPKPEWNTCIKGYRKQADEWLTDEYPRSLDGWLKVYHGQGAIHDMEIGRRYTWRAHDHVCGEPNRSATRSGRTSMMPPRESSISKASTIPRMSPASVSETPITIQVTK